MYLLWLMWCSMLTVPAAGYFKFEWLREVLSSGSVALLCRNCGHEIVEGSTLSNERSVKAIRSYNMTILGRNQLVQVFENAVPEKFDVITASAAELKLAGKSYLADTWFPNYEWTVCVCPNCGYHLGWYFQSGNIQAKLQKSFFGLVLDYLISEEYVDLLTWVP
uniref:CULT domain-containing protein n=1 Tax=Setaria digitata TaxID=48799 RepID=A0A915PIB9_9BILA